MHFVFLLSLLCCSVYSDSFTSNILCSKDLNSVNVLQISWKSFMIYWIICLASINGRSMVIIYALLILITNKSGAFHIYVLNLSMLSMNTFFFPFFPSIYQFILFTDCGMLWILGLRVSEKNSWVSRYSLPRRVWEDMVLAIPNCFYFVTKCS